MPRQPPPPGSLLYRLGARIQERRLAVGLTGQELADVIGTTRRAVTRYEAGHQQPPLETLARIAQAVDTPLSVLLSALDDYAPPSREVRAWTRRKECRKTTGDGTTT